MLIKANLKMADTKSKGPGQKRSTTKVGRFYFARYLSREKTDRYPTQGK